MKIKSSFGTLLKKILRWICSTVGALLFSFCLLYNIVVFVLGIPDGTKAFPILLLPANLIYMTLGVDYWIGDDAVRRWVYFLSNVVLSALMLLVHLDYSLSHHYSTLLGLLAAILLPLLMIIYSFRTVLKKKTCIQAMAETSPSLSHSPLRLWLRAAIRMLILFSICCVLLESWHRTIQFTYRFLTISDFWLSNHTRAQIFLSILSVILLVRFVKAEFTQQNPPNE